MRYSTAGAFQIYLYHIDDNKIILLKRSHWKSKNAENKTFLFQFWHPSMPSISSSFPSTIILDDIFWVLAEDPYWPEFSNPELSCTLYDCSPLLILQQDKDAHDVPCCELVGSGSLRQDKITRHLILFAPSRPSVGGQPFQITFVVCFFLMVLCSTVFQDMLSLWECLVTTPQGF